jgi:uncharacterized glyoxalase superfamily metalloenzyme YdcJ
MAFKELWQLREAFAIQLSEMYGSEVPAYNTLVEVSIEVNRDYMARLGDSAERLGTIDRVTAERHGAIRVGSPDEMSEVARIFAAFGMHPVGFYDLRDAAASVPVVSTAFRPTTSEELARNPFRVFTSMLAVDDPRFFSEDHQRRLKKFIDSRTLFSSELLELADLAAQHGGLQESEARRLISLATDAFRLSDEPVDYSWYKELEAISAVAADIGGVRTTHINHLTPRVLDIDDLYRRMEDLGITMIDEIQGPPAWDGPDVLLRQTSFRALDEKRIFEFEDGTVGPGELRVRFGEVEQRGIALTPKGRELYDEMLVETDRRLASDGGSRDEVARQVWTEYLPDSERGLAERDLAFFTYRLADDLNQDIIDSLPESVSLEYLVDEEVVVADPIVYEDFLPRSAAGIFQSNLTGEGSRDDELSGAVYDINTISRIVGRPVADPHELYRAQQESSLRNIEKRIQRVIESYS